MTVGEITAHLTLDLSSFRAGLQRATKMLDDNAQAMQRAGTVMAGFGAAITGAFAGAVKAAVDFEAQMRNVNSIVKSSETTLQGLSQEVLGLARKTGQGPATLAAGLYDIASSGFAGADGLKVLEASAVAATAGISDTATASKGLTAVLNAYGLGADQAQRIADVLFKTVDAGVITFGELATQLGDVVSTASQANVSIEEIGAAISVMTRAGVQPAEAVTSLNQVLLSFIDPTDDAKKAAAGLGIELSATALASKGLGGVMQDIARGIGTTADDLDALADSGKSDAEIMQIVAERSGSTSEAMAKLFPNVRALRGALVLAAGGASELSGDLEAMQSASGAAGEAFEEQSKSTQVQWNKMKATIQAAAVVIGNQLLPALQPMINALASLATKASEWMKENQGLTKVLVTVGAVVGTLSLALGGLVLVFPQVVAGIASVRTALKALRVAMAALAVGGGPLTLLITGIAALGAAIYTLVKHFRGAKKAADEQAEATKKQTEEHLKLAKRAQELADKTERTKDEHDELRDIMNKLGDAYPDLIKSYDSEGNALINLTELLREFNEEQREDLRLAEERAKAHRKELSGAQAEAKILLDAKKEELKSAQTRKKSLEKKIEELQKEGNTGGLYLRLLAAEEMGIASLRRELSGLRTGYAAAKEAREAAFRPIVEQAIGTPEAAKKTPPPPPLLKGGGGGGGAEPPSKLEQLQAYQAHLKILVAQGKKTWNDYYVWLAWTHDKFLHSAEDNLAQYAIDLGEELEQARGQAAQRPADIYAQRAGDQDGAVKDVMQAFAANFTQVSEEAIQRQKELEADWFRWRLDQGQVDLAAHVADCRARVAATDEETRERLEAEQQLADAKERLRRHDEAEIARFTQLAQAEIDLLDRENMTLEQQLQAVVAICREWETAANATLPLIEDQIKDITDLIAEEPRTSKLADLFWGALGYARDILSTIQQWARGAASFGDVLNAVVDPIVPTLWGAIQDAQRGIASAFGDFLHKLMDGTADWGDLMDSILQSIRDALIDIFAQKAAASLVGTIGSILGLASGGVVTRPTLAVVGEAGPEAVVPLTQMSSLLPMVAGASEGRGRGTMVHFEPGAFALSLDNFSDWQLYRLADRVADIVFGSRFVPSYEWSREGAV